MQIYKELSIYKKELFLSISCMGEVHGSSDQKPYHDLRWDDQLFFSI